MAFRRIVKFAQCAPFLVAWLAAVAATTRPAEAGSKARALTLTLTPSELGLPEGWTAGQFRAELSAVGASWNAAGGPCGAPQVVVAPVAALRTALPDTTSLVVFRPRRWCHNQRCGRGSTFPRLTMGMTTTYPEGARGEAVEGADIELNAAHFVFTHTPPAERASTGAAAFGQAVPLRAVLLHEVGHALGLEDRCAPAAAGHRSPPDPANCAPGEAGSVMYAPALHLQLSTLDTHALCRLYSSASASEQPAAGTDSAGARPLHRAPGLVPAALVLGIGGLALGLALRRAFS